MQCTSKRKGVARNRRRRWRRGSSALCRPVENCFQCSVGRSHKYCLLVGQVICKRKKRAYCFHTFCLLFFANSQLIQSFNYSPTHLSAAAANWWTSKCKTSSMFFGDEGQRRERGKQNWREAVANYAFRIVVMQAAACDNPFFSCLFIGLPAFAPFQCSQFTNPQKQ